jgi:hypothetical protein
MSMVQPRNPAEPPRDGLHDATQMCEQVVAAVLQPLRQHAGAVRTVTATSASLPQRKLCEHVSLETWINAHGACPLMRPLQATGSTMAAGRSRPPS